MRTIPVPAGTRLIILDLDDTLVTMPIDWHAMKQALAGAFADVSFASLSEGVRVVSRVYGEEGRARCYRLICAFEEAAVQQFQPVEPALAVIQSYRDRCSFAICSNNMHSTIEQVVRALDLDGVFGALVGRDDVIETKPSPEGLLAILSRLQVGAEEALFIGNHETDLRAGTEAGIRTLLVAPC